MILFIVLSVLSALLLTGTLESAINEERSVSRRILAQITETLESAIKQGRSGSGGILARIEAATEEWTSNLVYGFANWIRGALGFLVGALTLSHCGT